MLARVWRKGNPCALLVGMWTGAAPVENSIDVAQKIKNMAAIGSSNPISGNLSEENKNTNLKRYMHPTFTATSAVRVKQGSSLDSISRGVGREHVVHNYIHWNITQQ